MQENLQKQIEQDYERIFADTQQFYLDLGAHILMSHFGVFSQDLVTSLGEGVEEILIAANERKPLIKRIFSIFVEGLQNIRIHGEADNNQEKNGLIIFAKKDDSYYISLGNLVQNHRTNSITEKINQLNELDENSLKELYMKVLSNGIISNKGGAGLGIITMRMKSKTPVAFSFSPVTEELSLFIIELEIKKE